MIREAGYRPNSPAAITQLFHRLSRLLPVDQQIICVRPDTTAGEALLLMKQNGFSQLPVVEGGEVLGVFSFRSFALESIAIRPRGDQSIGDMPVEELMEVVGPNTFARMTDEFVELFDRLDRLGAVLVGDPNRLQGIVTGMDVLRYLYDVASPFVLLEEIELGIRALIQCAVSTQELADCAALALTAYKPELRPARVEDMTFNDYAQLVGDGRNWPRFQPVFGGTRERTRAKLESIRDLRNDIFHFRRDVTVEDHETLASFRSWVLMKSRAFDATRRERAL